MQTLVNPAPQLPEILVTVRNDPFDQHKIDQGNVLIWCLLLILEYLIYILYERGKQRKVFPPVTHLLYEPQHKCTSHPEYERKYWLSSGYWEKKVSGRVRWNSLKPYINSSTSPKSSCSSSKFYNYYLTEFALKSKALVWLIISLMTRAVYE